MSIGTQWRYTERAQLLARRIETVAARLERGEHSDDLDLEAHRIEQSLCTTLHPWLSAIDWAGPVVVWASLTPGDDALEAEVADFVTAITALAACFRHGLAFTFTYHDTPLYDDLMVYGDGTCGIFDFNALTDIRLLAAIRCVRSGTWYREPQRSTS